MAAGPYVVLRAAARLYLPLALVFAFSLFTLRPPGSAVGLVAALAFALALILHVVVFGAAAARAALPPVLMRVLLGAGLGMILLGVGAPNVAHAGQVIEAGLFLISTATLAMFVIALAGRAPSLREEPW